MEASIAQLAKKSDRNWILGKKEFEDGKHDFAANRLYYSVFQAIKCYGVERGRMAMERSVDVHAKAAEIVGEGKCGAFFRKSFVELRSLREKADYQPEMVERVEIEDVLENAEKIRLFHLEKAGIKSK